MSSERYIHTPLGDKRFLDFFISNGMAATFGDARLKPAPSWAPAATVNTETWITKQLKIPTPFMAAAMRSVSGAALAIEMAILGGVAVLPYQIGIEAQREALMKVKHFLSGFIPKPICINTGMSVGEVDRMRRERQFRFHSFPVLDENGRFAGMMTSRDFEACFDPETLVLEAMTPASEVVWSGPGTTIQDASVLMGKKHTLPLLDGDMRVVGLYTRADVNRVLKGGDAAYSLDHQGRLMAGVSLPTNPERAKEILSELYNPDPDKVRPDFALFSSAHGNTMTFMLPSLEKTKEEYPELPLISANVSDGASAKLLAEAGADAVNVGQGGGSICTSRKVNGTGTPQLVATYESTKAIDTIEDEDRRCPTISDGGIVESGDPPLVIASGANAVMMGRPLVGVDESAAESILVGGQLMKRYAGEGSIEMLRQNADRYRQTGVDPEDLVPEGVSSYVPATGSLAKTMHRFNYGLRGAMEHTGSKTIEDLRQASIIGVTPEGMRESGPHDLTQIIDAPQYQSQGNA